MVSVIVPVYNLENYLPRCLNSILGQTYNDLEIFLIDDGSTDNSGIICDRYALKDRRIRTIHQNNQGLSGARNTGLRNVSGEYIIMIDGDDALHPQMIETLYHHIISNNYDFAMCYSEKINDVMNIPQLSAKSIILSNAIELDRDTCIENFFSGMISYYVVWNKLYKRAFIDYLYFSKTASEDVDFNNRVYLRMNKAILLPIGMYFYIQRSDSILHQGSKRMNLHLASTVLSWKLCLDAIPDKFTYYRALCLKHLYKLMPQKRFWSRGTSYHQLVIDNVTGLRKNTIREFLSNPHIKISDKIIMGGFNFCPFIYWIFITLTELKARRSLSINHFQIKL